MISGLKQTDVSKPMIAMDGRSVIASKRKLHGIDTFVQDNRPGRNSGIGYKNSQSQERSMDRLGYSLAAAGLSQIEQSRLKQVEPKYYVSKRNSLGSDAVITTPMQLTPLKVREPANILDALDAGPPIRIGPSDRMENYGYPTPDRKVPLKPRESIHRNRDFSKFMVENQQYSSALANHSQLSNSAIKDYSGTEPTLRN